MKKGFTLAELLAVIVILAIILAIAVPTITSLIESSRLQAYLNSEKMVERANLTFMAANMTEITLKPTDIKITKISELISNNYLLSFKDPKDSLSDCSGYVITRLSEDGLLEHNPYIRCGVNYTSEGYSEEYMNPNTLTNVEVLVVAGGGSGCTSGYGNGGGGGGGAGGLIHNNNYMISGSLIDVYVGAGGAARTELVQTGLNGENSSFDSLVAIGGGGGGKAGGQGLVGGSGGGAGYYYYKYRIGPDGIPGQGNKGGDVLGNNNGAGGGGAGGPGGNTPDTAGTAGGSGGIGGAGLIYSISGSDVMYAKGGSGGSSSPCGKTGEPNTGNGGDGVYAVYTCTPSGAGGSGIVIVRYPGPQKANGGIVTEKDGYIIHTFINIGTSSFTLLDL